MDPEVLKRAAAADNDDGGDANGGADDEDSGVGSFGREEIDAAEMAALMDLARRAWRMLEVSGNMHVCVCGGDVVFTCFILFRSSTLPAGCIFTHVHTHVHTPPRPQVDQQEVARQDADKAAAERSRREEVERQKQERLRLEQVGGLLVRWWNAG